MVSSLPRSAEENWVNPDSLRFTQVATCVR
jgi:hypothetical protein